MIDVGGFVVAAAIVLVEMTSTDDLWKMVRRCYGRSAQQQPFLTSPKKYRVRAPTAQTLAVDSQEVKKDRVCSKGPSASVRDAIRWRMCDGGVPCRCWGRLGGLASGEKNRWQARTRQRQQRRAPGQPFNSKRSGQEPSPRLRTPGNTCGRWNTESGVANQECCPGRWVLSKASTRMNGVTSIRVRPLPVAKWPCWSSLQCARQRNWPGQRSILVFEDAVCLRAGVVLLAGVPRGECVT